jgi:mannose-6-phosphate isomerase-like protein (cupin superfamily)
MKYIVNINDVPVKQITGRKIMDLVNGEITGSKKMSLRITDVLPEETASPGHTHTACEEIIFVSSGHGRIKIEDETYEMKQGDAIYLPQGVRHLFKNDGKEVMRLFCAFSTPDFTRDLQSETSMDFD